MKKTKLTIVLLAILSSVQATAAIPGNTYNESFSKAKKIMQHQIYTNPVNMKTLYCHAQFNEQKQITLPNGFINAAWKKRSFRWEAEHVTPAENFGKSFSAWRDGAPECVNRKGEHYKGRRCANRASKEYRYMQSDLFNLFPAMGSINAAHSNYRWSMLPNIQNRFGSCDFRYDKKTRTSQPPLISRGEIARAELYMSAAYPRYRLSSSQRKLFLAWDKQVPVTKWDCERAKKIEKIQGNQNPFIVKQCKVKNWY